VKARLLRIEVERFKSYREPTAIDFTPLTILLGPNNSGKSTLIQALLLLKQTLAHARTDVPLHLEGIVDALSLRELTFGWPEAGEYVRGPKFTLYWQSEVHPRPGPPSVRLMAPYAAMLARRVGDDTVSLRTKLVLSFAEVAGRTVLDRVQLGSASEDTPPESIKTEFDLRRTSEGTHLCQYQGHELKQDQIDIKFDHFLPYLSDLGSADPVARRHGEWHDVYLHTLSEPIDQLRQLLLGFSYLGSMRATPTSLYRPAHVPPDEIGVSGEYAAQMLQKRQSDLIHYLPPLAVTEVGVAVPERIRARSLVEAVKDVFGSLGVSASLRIEDIRDVGFRILFGKTTLQHVGSGLSSLLPVVQLGLIADPLRFDATLGDNASLGAYLEACLQIPHCAMEEPETHLHPKVQSRLAHWFVALAMAGRHLIVETQSDHMVRRLRGLAARAGQGSTLEQWLLENVAVVEVEQDEGRSTIYQSKLTAEGGIAEHWPADFMDEATEEERQIYHATLDKPQPEAPYAPGELFVHDEGPEPE
jgi:predicted ATPase